ncbi:MAG: PAS domain-containing protein [Planctomycetes bacterium]|nr:PAS domain-containing protein [Planctomycetota bacterium]MCB9886033.1 PAS domain-containing protein [Planctomycetota bacterium]
MLFGLVVAAGAAVWSAAAIAAGAALAAGFENRRARRETAATLRIQRTAATREDERGAEVHRLTLELAYERSRSVLEALQEGVVVIDVGGEVVMANPAAQSAMPGVEGRIEGQLLWDLLPDELARRARSAWALLGENQQAGSQLEPVRYLSIPAGSRIFDLTAVRVKSARTGQDFGFAFLLIDCTRSHELQQLKDRFLSSVSHELRTPLTNICAFAEILGTMLPGESMEWPEFVRVIHEESVQLSRLVDAMFDYLQLEGGEAILRDERVDGAAVVREVAATAQPGAAARRIDLVCAAPGAAAELVVDASRLRQLCSHLVDNAVKFTPDGGRVRVEVRVADGSWQLAVEDSGPGIPEAERRQVFEKFHQLPDLLTDKPSGTGLGLATCAAIANRYQGTIACGDSALGGARFVVRLPTRVEVPLAGAASV